MEYLYTKNGKPLVVVGDDIFDRNGRHVGRRRGNKVFAPNGKYAGTIVRDRVSYQSAHRGATGPSVATRARVGIARADRAASGIPGEEPFTDASSR